jgi:hypothetical protein
MFDVYLNIPSGRRGMGFTELTENCISICNEHLRNGRASAFAFIFYDMNDAHVRKALRDDYYWTALDALSADHLTVFSLHLPPTPQLQYDFSSNAESLSMMIDVKSSSANPARRFLRRTFGLESQSNGPFVVLFQVSDSAIMDSILIRIEGSDMDEVYNDLVSIFTHAIEGVNRSRPLQEGSSVFASIRSQLKKRQTLKVISRGYEFAKSLKDLTSLFS